MADFHWMPSCSIQDLPVLPARQLTLLGALSDKRWNIGSLKRISSIRQAPAKPGAAAQRACFITGKPGHTPKHSSL